MRELPSGTVTFLFSDVQGSTQLLEQHGELLGGALARHHELFVHAVDGAGGAIFETVGDAVYAAFAQPVMAIQAAIGVQRALAREHFEPIGSLSCRIAIHTGPVERTGGHYFGPALFRAARLEAIAHGGQVLVSDVTAGLLDGKLPDGAQLADLGVHRLKDLQEPRRVFMLRHPELRDGFPALRSIDARPNNLPIQSTSLLGRDSEIGALSRLLDDHSLVTIAGAGGMGKTRLALQVAAHRLERHPDGAFFVDLAPLDDSGLVSAAVASVLGIAESGGEELSDTIAGHLAARNMMLVLDNYEHLPGAVGLAATWAHASRESRVLATSRGPLHVRGEQVFRLDPLGADADGDSQPAVLLLTERAARAGAPGWAGADELSIVAEICRRLDGLPLAIELAAARAPLLSPREMLSRLQRHLPVAGRGGRDLADRQQTLQSAIGWSYDLLTDDDRRGFRSLAVLAGPFDLDRASAISEAEDPLFMVEHLVDVGLLQAVHDEGSTRFRMLETIREYALERLRDSGETDAVRDRHAVTFAALAITLGGRFEGDELSRKHRDVLTANLDNLRAAFDRLEDQARGPELSAMALALGHFFGDGATLSEGRRWFARAAGLHGLSALDRARLWAAEGRLASRQGLGADAHDLVTRAAATFEELSATEDLRDALVTLSNVAVMERKLEELRDAALRAIELARATGDARSEAAATGNLAVAEQHAGNLDAAEAGLLRTADLFREIGHLRSSVVALGNLVSLAHQRGNIAAARAHAETGIREARSLDDPGMLGWIKASLASAEVTAGDLSTARALLGESIPLLSDAEDGMALRDALAEVGRVCAATGRPEALAELWAAVTASAGRAGLPSEETPALRTLLIDVRALLGEEAWEQHWSRGSRLTDAEAVARAMQLLEPIPPLV